MLTLIDHQNKIKLMKKELEFRYADDKHLMAK